MINKRIFYTLFTSVTISGFIVICTLGQSIRAQKMKARSAEKPQELPRVECIVREYKGKIGVFRGESSTPYQIIDFDTSLLSEYDREMLSEGIIMNSEAELNTFIEDMAT